MAEEAAEAGGAGKVQLSGDRASPPPGRAEQAAGSQEAAFADHPAGAGGAGVPGGAGEGAHRAAEQPCVTVHVVQLAEVEFQGVEEPLGESCTAGGGQGNGRSTGTVGEAQQESLEEAAAQCVAKIEGAPSQGTVWRRGAGGRCARPKGASSGCGVRTAGASCAVAAASRRATSAPGRPARRETRAGSTASPRDRRGSPRSW